MTILDKHIVNSYSRIFDTFNKSVKIKLIEKLKKSLTEENSNRERDFYNSFGMFASDKSAEEIVSEIKGDRYFK